MKSKPKRPRTKFIYNEKNNPIGRVDPDGNLYTMKGNPSSPYYQTPLGPAVNKAHQERGFYAKTEFDEDEDEE